MCPRNVVTVFNSILNLRQVQIQSSEFSAHRQMLYVVVMFGPGGLCQVCVLMQAWKRPTSQTHMSHTLDKGLLAETLRQHITSVCVLKTCYSEFEFALNLNLN